MSNDTAKKKSFTWKERLGRTARRKTETMKLAPTELSENETDAVSALGGSTCGLDGLANGMLATIAQENGEVTERGMRRVRCAVKFLSGLLGGKKHKEAMAESGLTWGQINSFLLVSPEFEKMYQAAKGGMKRAMGAQVLDTAMELAIDGEDVYDKDGNAVGKKKSEKMLDRLLVLSGREFHKATLGAKNAGTTDNGGGITLNFHFDGRGRPGATEVVNVG